MIHDFCSGLPSKKNCNFSCEICNFCHFNDPKPVMVKQLCLLSIDGHPIGHGTSLQLLQVHLLQQEATASPGLAASFADRFFLVTGHWIKNRHLVKEMACFYLFQEMSSQYIGWRNTSVRSKNFLGLFWLLVTAQLPPPLCHMLWWHFQRTLGCWHFAFTTNLWLHQFLNILWLNSVSWQILVLTQSDLITHN